jgi:hypothetical protein
MSLYLDCSWMALSRNTRVHNATGLEYSHIHSRLNEACGGPIGVATVDQLQHRVDLLMGWLERGEV